MNGKISKKIRKYAEISNPGLPKEILDELVKGYKKSYKDDKAFKTLMTKTKF
jgi:hypothetical protein